MSYYLLHFLDNFRMGDMQYLKEYLDEGHGAIHCGIEVTRQQFFCYLLENKENLLICEALFNEKKNDSVHTLAVTNIGIVLGNTRQSFSQPFPHFCLSQLFFDAWAGQMQFWTDIRSFDILLNDIEDIRWQVYLLEPVIQIFQLIEFCQLNISNPSFLIGHLISFFKLSAQVLRNKGITVMFYIAFLRSFEMDDLYIAPLTSFIWNRST